jgi:hypothetical protein
MSDTHLNDGCPKTVNWPDKDSESGVSLEEMCVKERNLRPGSIKLMKNELEEISPDKGRYSKGD